MDKYAARRTFDFNALSCIFIQSFAIFFQRAVHWGDLLQRSREQGLYLLQFFRREIHLGFRDDFAFCIRRAGALTQAQHSFVGFVGIQMQLAEFGGRAKAKRQHTCCHRV